ncbi:MAG TPA: extracellular solute-binding protein [Candidatus Limiplasma sp.]|nr:extracellular solute-binding protein [Candidatus Limiplasma sp.]
MKEARTRVQRTACFFVLLFVLLAAVCAAQADVLSFEAEDGALTGNAAVASTGSMRYVQIPYGDGDGVDITVTVSETGFYDLSVWQASRNGDYKENYILLDGEQIGTVSVESDAFLETVLERLYITQGEHTVSVRKYWGGVKIDRITLAPSQPLGEELFDITPTLVNPNASDNALRLMHYLCDIYGDQILSGQYCDGGMYGMENAAIWRATGGKYPAVLGLDLIDYSPSRAANGAESGATDYAIEYWNAGGIVTLTWHWNAPEEYLTGIWYKGFYADQTNIDLAAIMNGEDEAGYTLLLRDIDAIAEQLKILQDAGVPVLWRPLHEASGGWFWWGASGSDAYLKLYDLLYDRLTNYHGLNNLIWVWNGQDAAWYPGDDKVDIIGEDIYPGEHVYTPQTAKFIQATKYTTANKIIILSENGCLFDPELAVRDGAMWGMFCTWGGEFVLENEGFNALSEQYTEASMVQKVYESDTVITRSDLPDLCNYPLPETAEETPAQEPAEEAAAEQTAVAAAPVEDTMDCYYDLVSTYSIDDSVLSYTDYTAAMPAAAAQDTVVIDAQDYIRYEESGTAVYPILMTNYEGMTGTAVLTGEEALISYTVDVPQSGWYDLSLTYFPVEGKNAEIQRAFFIDGKLPYKEMALVEFCRVWANTELPLETDANGVQVIGWTQDNQGNDVKPSPFEIPEWMTAKLYDKDGYISEPLSVYLTAGEHTLTLLSLREPMLLKAITLGGREDMAMYAQVKSAWDEAGAADTTGQSIRIEAENAVKTSSQMLYPQQEQGSPAVYPASAKALLNNTIGGNSWRLAGQWIEWEFTAEADGYYCITLFDRQNFVRGVDVSRRITIDGEVPYDEFSAYAFAYTSNWRAETLSDENGEPYRIYLTAGTHTLRMEVVLGDMAAIVGRVQDCVQKLNAVYRKVIYITGVSPDKYRDYQLEASLPALEGDLTEVRDELTVAFDTLLVTAGENSDKLTVLRTMLDQLDELIYDQERFTEVLSSFKINVRALGNWITDVLPQPLQIDRIYIHSADTVPDIANNSWGAKALHEVSRLYYSFVVDYNQIGNVVEESEEIPTITLWVGTGRDQANVIKSLIDEKFTNEYGIGVNVQLVDMNMLLRATLAGQGPDVAIQVANTNGIAGAVLNVGNDTPVNFGIRNAVMDLTQFDDFAEIAQRFAQSAMVPFSFNGATYALPDTYTFPMLFYRKDILAEIGLEVPTTWDEVKVAMSVLAKNQMEFGMLPSEQIFAMLLFQNGGAYYTENGDKSLLDSDIAVSTFKQYCEFYTDYKLDKETSVEERFRTGECPLIIADYTLYNNLQVSAPDILGLWDFTTVPGTVQADGSVSYAASCVGLADIIMADTAYPDECWTFLKWWTSTETQVLYGREMESLMGASARVATANLEALQSLPWPIRDYRALTRQLSYVEGIPQVPGGYYSWRNINNAFFSVTTDSSKKVKDNAAATPREELMEKVYYINAEITYKRQEFGLPIADEE